MSDESTILKPPSSTGSLQLPTKASLQLPSNGNITVPTSAQQKLNATGSSGSATGNPRNKCALKPGHSLMDWVRLGNSGADLSGTRGRVVPVSAEELARHNKVDDAWMAIRGRVFNVTRYMNFHPGGTDELMRGVGRDATKLFDEVHAWVNYSQLLGKCYIGPLKQTPQVATSNDLRKKLLDKNATDGFAKPPLPMTTATEIIPRFDWIQKRNEITFYIYTRQFANPGLMLQRKTPQNLLLRIQLAHVWHEYDFELEHEVKWPPNVLQIGAETGKIELSFAKVETELWTYYGTHKAVRVGAIEAAELTYDYEIRSRESINQDSIELSLRSVKENTLLLVPMGYHVTIETPVNGEIVQRSYTPVDKKFLKQHTSEESSTNSSCKPNLLNFLIKTYENGSLSTHLANLEIGSVLQISSSRGNFKLQPLAGHRSILMLAAGSGLTPFLNLIDPLLKRNTNRIENLRLLYFNKTTQDIWSRETLADIEKSDERFSCVHILSQADDTWTGETGRITKDILQPLSDKTNIEAVTFIAICGPNAFNSASLEILKELNFKMDNVHIFQG